MVEHVSPSGLYELFPLVAEVAKTFGQAGLSKLLASSAA